ncbi:hypothetical protein SLS54_008056 [Diplodia seriata]
MEAIAAAIIIGVSLFIKSILFFQLESLSISIPSLWRYGLGKTNSYALIGGTLGDAQGATGFLIQVLFANSFQLLVSLCYLFANRLLTTQVATAEWLRFLDEKKPLRVSSPEGMQRSSYMLSLPWRFAAPAVVAFVLLHWLVSTSVFLVQTTAYASGPDAQRIHASDASRIGFSPIGILCAVCAGVLVLAALIGIGFRRYGDVEESLVRIATCSSGISALCRPCGEDDEGWLFPVSLGVVADGGEERMTFSSDVHLTRPLEGSELLLPVVHEPKSFLNGKRTLKNGFKGLWTGLTTIWDSLRKKFF